MHLQRGEMHASVDSGVRSAQGAMLLEHDARLFGLVSIDSTLST